MMSILVRLGRQTKLEQRAFWRNPDYAFFTLLLPLLLLALLGAVNSGDEIGDRTDINAIDLVVPGVVAFAVMVSAYANLASRLAVLRADGVLKRIRTTPLDPRAYLTAQLLSTLVTTLLASAATILLGFVAFDVSPRAEGVLALALGLVLGIICFAALGLALSSAISHADAAGPITHATYLPLALVSGVFDPSINIPGWLETLVSLFPVQALVELLVAAYDPTADGVPLGDSLVLAIWGIGAIAIAMRTFSWVPSRN